tara:strand:+ start:599 stop:1282 length:684 start_codon:yes stop_codon:yes gene_type:complete
MSLKSKLSQIKENIFAAKEKSGLGSSVKIIAVTKTRPFSIIRECYQLGIKSIGENRVQEADYKFKSFLDMPEMERRFIGHLQSNKINKCLELFDTIDSIDSVKLSKKISNKGTHLGKTIPVLLEVNTSGEIQKHGFLPGEEDEMLSCLELPGINVKGLMTVGPNTNDEKKIRNSFTRLRNLKTSLNEQFGGAHLSELSMGMSGDYQCAVEEGSTMVRLGTILFGPRL